MSTLFTPDAIEEVSAKISQALVDTFRLMFSLDVRYLPQPENDEQAKQVCAHIHLSSAEANAVLCVAVTRAVLASIVEMVEAPSPQQYDEATMDIVCEISNIIGNQLRAYMNDHLGCHAGLSLPQKGCYKPDTDDESVFVLNFKIDKNDRLEIGLHLATH